MKFNNRNVFIGENVQLGKNVKIGDNTSIYDNVVIGDNAMIANNCIIGEPLSEFYSQKNYQNPKTVIGANSLIRSHTIIYADVNTGENFTTGHRVTIREKTNFGKHCQVGTSSDIQGYSEFGKYCKLHSSVHICQHSKLGNFVFIYPFAVLTNDPHPPSEENNQGPIIDDYSQIAVHCTIHPNVKIGRNCLLGAHSNLRKNMPDFSVFMGNPAKFLCNIREVKSKKSGVEHYPWMENYKKDMPWEKIGFEAWLEQNRGD